MINDKAGLEKFASRILRIAASSAFILGALHGRESWEISVKIMYWKILLLFSYTEQIIDNVYTWNHSYKSNFLKQIYAILAPSSTCMFLLLEMK